MERFAIERNVAAFVDRFRSEANPYAREVLRRLLISEEDKFARRTEKIEIVEQYISDCRRRIGHLQKLNVGSDSLFPKAATATQMIENLNRLVDILEQHRDLLRKQLNEGKI